MLTDQLQLRMHERIDDNSSSKQSTTILRGLWFKFFFQDRDKYEL